MAAQYYKRSGRPSLIPFIGAIVIGAIVAAGAAWGYAYFTFYNPIIYIGIFGTAVFGAIVGGGAGLMLSALKSRSAAQDFIVGVLVALFAVWIYWCFWAGVSGYGAGWFTRMPLLDKLQAGPMLAYSYVFDGLSDLYTISIGRRGRSGGGLEPQHMEYIWWAETAIIVLVAVFVAMAMASGTPYNEKTKSVAVSVIDDKFPGLAGEVIGLKAAFERGDFSALLSLGTPGTESDHPDAKVELCRDEKDADFNLLSVDQVTYSLDKDGDVESNDETIVSQLYISAADAEALTAYLGPKS